MAGSADHEASCSKEYFAEAGVAGLVESRSKLPGRKPISTGIKLKVVEKTVKERPANATHWSVRTMAKEIGISHTSVQRIWAEHNLKPHLVKSFKVSTDPNFAVKVEDVIGLYLDPPERRSCWPPSTPATAQDCLKRETGANWRTTRQLSGECRFEMRTRLRGRRIE